MGNSEFSFSLPSHRGTLKVLGKKAHCFPCGQSLSAYQDFCIPTTLIGDRFGRKQVPKQEVKDLSQR